MRRAMVSSAIFLLGGLLSACATSSPHLAPPALLRLSPASLGGTLSLQQQLWVSAQGQEHRFDAVLEVDAEAVRLAVLNLGQTVARLEWDGKNLTESKVAWWPSAVSGERVLSDLQLMLWPVAEIAAALPPGWAVEQSEPQLRTLRDGQELVATVRYLTPTVAELAQLRQAYRIRVESRPLESAP
jgi:hypothetical protein